MRTVLVVAHECAPYHRPEATVGAQRPAQFAKHLPEFGWRAIVLCRDYRAASAPTAEAAASAALALVRDAPTDRSLIIPVPALRSDGIIDRVWRAAVERSTHRAAWALPRKALTLMKFFLGDYSQNWQPAARAAAAALAAEMRIDMCVGEHSPDAGVFVARWFARSYGVPWLVDFRDPMLFGYHARVRPFLAPFARRALSGAARVVTVTPACRDIDVTMFDASVDVVTNGFDPDEFVGAPQYQGNRVFTIVYTGGVWFAENMRLFFAGLAQAVARPEVRSAIRFQYRGGSDDLVRELAREAGVSDLCEILSRVPREDALACATTADVLLVLSPSGHPDPYWRRGVYPGKTFEYLGAGRPILAVPGDHGILDDLLKETRAGVAAYDASSVAETLTTLWRSWHTTGRLEWRPDATAVARYTRRATTARFASILDSVVADHASAARNRPNTRRAVA